MDGVPGAYYAFKFRCGRRVVASFEDRVTPADLADAERWNDARRAIAEQRAELPKSRSKDASAS